MFRALAILLFAVTLQGCGFQVRGSSSIPPQMDITYISAADRHSVFYKKLRDQFKSAGIVLVDDAASATAVFSIYLERTGQRVLSVSARNVPTEYEIYYTISYGLDAGQTVLLDRRTQTRKNDYTWDETEVLGKAHEEQVLRDALVDELVRVVMIQVGAL